MTLTKIDGGWAYQLATEFARRGPWGGLLCAVWKLNKTTEAGSQGSNTPMGPWPGELIFFFVITVLYQNNCPASLGQTLPEQAFVNYVLGQYFAGLIW